MYTSNIHQTEPTSILIKFYSSSYIYCSIRVANQGITESIIPCANFCKSSKLSCHVRTQLLMIDGARIGNDTVKLRMIRRCSLEVARVFTFADERWLMATLRPLNQYRYQKPQARMSQNSTFFHKD